MLKSSQMVSGFSNRGGIKMMRSAYAADGVNVSEGDKFSAFAGEICRESYGNSPYVKVQDLSHGHFRGPRTFKFTGLPRGYTMDAAPDGIGTKVIVIDAATSQRKACNDLVAMTKMDITRFGGLGLVFINVFDVNTLGRTGDATNLALRECMVGMGEVCKEQQMVAFKGETAELGPCVGSENPQAATKFNWAGMTIGVYHPKMMITGDGLKAGQLVMALKEEGLRSNGHSTARKALALKFGFEWWKNPDAAAAIAAIATPSVLYDHFLSDANGWYNRPTFSPKIKVHLVVHVTGGAIKSKFAEDILFPRGLGAALTDLWDPPQIMKDCFEWRNLAPGKPFTDEDAYETFHGGQGALAVIDRKDFRDFCILAHQHGICAKKCGVITKARSHPMVFIKSKFTDKDVIYKKE